MTLPLLLPLPPNRVRRNYRGGQLLDAWEGAANPIDSCHPEDWLASTTPARNPGMEPIPDEGLSPVVTGNGSKRLLRDLFREAPQHFLGRDHTGTQDAGLGFLAKLLDSAMRLHVQAHPTRAFARRHLGSPWGKLETYVILGVRPGANPAIRLGFQRPPTPQAWRRIVLEQDITAMDACFDPIPVTAGEVWLIPGGLPHAIGAGLLVLEVMEPSDLVVRCEFEREGIIVPPAARFMGRDPDLALKIFDFTPRSPDQVRAACRIEPDITRDTPGLRFETLIGPEQTDAFRIYRATFQSSGVLPLQGQATIGFIVQGAGTLRSGFETLPLQRGRRFFAAAAANRVEITPDTALEVLLCTPAVARV